VKETPNHKLRYPETTDPNAYVSDLTNLAKDTERELDAVDLSQLVVPGGTEDDGKLVIVKDGAAAYRAMSGDVSINKDGVTQIGNNKLATGMYQDGSVATAKVADAAITSRKFKPSAGVVKATGDLTLGPTYADIAGASLAITPSVASVLYVTAVFHFVAGGAGGDTGYGTIRVDEADQTPTAVFRSESGLSQQSVAQVYEVPLSAATHAIKMRGMVFSAAPTLKIEADNTRFLWILAAT
jgi:hypothetical protein